MNSPIRLLICGGGQGWEYAGIAAVHFQQLKTSSVFYIYFLDECLMRYKQNEKEIKTRKKKKRKKEKVYLASLVSMIHIRCHSNVSYIKLTALVGKRRSLHSYGL